MSRYEPSYCAKYYLHMPDFYIRYGRLTHFHLLCL